MGHRAAVAMALAAAVMWGTTGTARALAPADAAPISVGAVRIAIGGALLVLLAAARGSLAVRWPRVPTVVAAVAVAAYQIAFFEGVTRAGVAIGTIVAIGSAPVFAGVIASAVLGERPTPRWAAATALAVAGVGLLSLPRAEVALAPLALVLPLAAGLAYATYATATKVLLSGRDSVAVAAVAFGGGGLLLAPLLVTSDLAWVGRPAGALVALELGVVATALAYVLFTSALARLPVSWGATASLAEPLTATLLGVVVLGETLGALQLAGAGLVALGLVLLAASPSRAVRLRQHGDARSALSDSPARGADPLREGDGGSRTAR